MQFQSVSVGQAILPVRIQCVQQKQFDGRWDSYVGISLRREALKTTRSIVQSAFGRQVEIEKRNQENRLLQELR
jgi:hypothetical protein